MEKNPTPPGGFHGIPLYTIYFNKNDVLKMETIHYFATSYDLPSVRSDHKGVVSPHTNDQSIGLYKNPKYRRIGRTGRTGTSGCCTGRTGTSGCCTGTELGATRTFPVKPIGEYLLRSH